MQLQQIGHAHITVKEVLTYTLIIIPLSVIAVTLGGGGHAPLPLMLPTLFLFGPLGFLAPTGGLAAVLFAILSPYFLYLFYGIIFAQLSGRNPTVCRLFLGIALLVQIGSGLFALSVRH
jgi:hypothetical protein